MATWNEPSQTTQARNQEAVYQTALVNYLISMARSVEGAVNRAVEALRTRNETLASEIFLGEPRINEMEIVIDEHAVRLLRAGTLDEEGIRFVVGTLKINNDLERMGDLAVNIAQRVISLAQMPKVEAPPEIEPMVAAVRAMVSKSLGAMIYRNIVLASEVLESDDIVDRYRDQVFDHLLSRMRKDPGQVGPNVHLILVARHLERIADHATNIAEDVIYLVEGRTIKHRVFIRSPR